MASLNKILERVLHRTPKVDPISQREESEEKSNHNTNRSNPFKGGIDPIKQQGDDQEQLDNTFTDKGGYLPIMAGIRERRQIRKALFDTQLMIPGMSDPGQGYGSPFMGAGEVNPRDPMPAKQRDWDFETNKSRTQRLHLRQNPQTKKQQPHSTEEDNRGLTDLSSESVA